MNLLVLFLGSLPLLWRAIPFLVPAQFLETYYYWDAGALNTPAADGRVPAWRNMGWWESGNETFTEANEALARRLLAFADAPKGGNVLDIAHGAGESLLIHLETSPEKLSALASLESDTLAARQLTADHPRADRIEWYTGSAAYRPTVDMGHPLNPMKGFLGEASGAGPADDGDGDEAETEDGAEDSEDEDGADQLAAEPPRGPEWDLVYVLDAAYHFPPSVFYFAHTVFKTLREGAGVLAYTDIIPPPQYSSTPLNVLGPIFGSFLGIPAANLNARPRSLTDYAEFLGRIGYTDVRIEDWSGHVWAGLANNLRQRGGAWALVAKAFAHAENSGWKFVAVRGMRPLAAVEAEE